jgi:prolyl-tRNA editing enzyme YbaK/EbsC (Cys-tRNA(Pro) deacylase)
MDPIERVRHALMECGLDPAIVQETSADTSTATAAAQAVNAELGSIVKSLVLLADGLPLLVLVAGDQQIDLRRLRTKLGLSKRRLRIARAHEVREHTGFDVGGVPPLGHHAAMRTLIDRTLGRFETVWAAAGDPSAVFPISYEQLVTVTSGEVLDLVE